VENQNNNKMGLETGPNCIKRSMTVMKALRLSHGYSLPDIENKGFNKYTYSHIESGKYAASKKIQVSIGDILAVRTYYIFDPFGYAVVFSPKDILSLAMAKKRKRKGNK